ncbi:MAG: hypothetical protein UV41_C0010G0029 [Candidatus Daviesbacteria bacterium GW2011_GWA2_42_7]|uniref:YoaR-like putative peptidoglycan binding domain-containing protein n=2 Tax=Candidatus Daviesiibacteriota TaxID=1752718 RepID=A0A0G1E8L3_9BACT|nr:MAG: hypothetical protein UV41_C0010G0029 [Candidatus Daviesbacteria bacterium GW2011_GWA2_42_7]
MNMMKTELLKPAIIYLLAFFTLALFLYLLFLTYYQDRFFPGVQIAGVDLGGKTPALAYQLIDTKFQERAATPIQVTYQDQSYSLSFPESKPQTDIRAKLTAAYSFGRSGNFLENFRDQSQALLSNLNFPLQMSYGNETPLKNQVTQIEGGVKKEAVNAQLTLGEDITVIPSKTGQELDREAFLQQIASYLVMESDPPTTLPITITEPKFSTALAQRAKTALESVKDPPISLSFEKSSWKIDQAVLLTLLDFNRTKPVLASLQLDGRTAIIEDITIASQKISDQELVLDTDKLDSYLLDLAKKIDRPTQDAKFKFDPETKRVRDFQPEEEGRKLDTVKTAELIIQALTGSSHDITLPVKVTKPKIAASSVNSFGIQELIGQGISHFTGSIENRIYNIRLAASRINGTLLPPGEIFSFNGTVGDISSASGYKQAYVIKSGRTVLDDGGGVCQVSTTLFRAALNSGLPVIERTAHAYRVGYYEQGFPPGLDATVFSPTVDFKFKNDTAAHVLIQAYVTGTTLYIDLYGTSDGRIAKLSTPAVTNQTPPPPELRQDDPELPRGVVKQVDWSAWGANVSFTRSVTRAGQTLISETFRSNYKPWQAVFLIGTKE